MIRRVLDALRSMMPRWRPLSVVDQRIEALRRERDLARQKHRAVRHIDRQIYDLRHQVLREGRK